MKEKDFDILLKTPKGLENIAATRVEELGGMKAKARPKGLLGLVLVKCTEMPVEEATIKILENVPEAEKVLPVYAIARAELDDIVSKAVAVVKDRLSRDETFAVRTTRRGSHDFTSIDVNVRAGAEIQKATGASVDLEAPDKIVWIEIIHDIAAISITHGRIEHKKLWPGKPYAVPILRKISIVQMPYTGPLDAVKTMGIRIGRAVQTFEVMELVVAPKEPIKAEELKTFLDGVFEGIESRYEIQRRSYGRPVHKVPVLVDNLYQLVLARRNEPIVVTSTRGEPLSKVGDKLVDLFKERRVSILIGAREGIPTGLFRFADLVVDLSPGVTISTDYACVAAIIGILTSLEERGALEIYRGKKSAERRLRHRSASMPTHHPKI
ncbi:MAG: RNA-binding protein [Thermoprotei archaeon]|nr:MAG: RNA-binding protein [Thermoprotei archaeon]RLF25391.1 MAG: RNA-binding protein [Thermoprotei archaeon]